MLIVLNVFFRVSQSLSIELDGPSIIGLVSSLLIPSASRSFQLPPFHLLKYVLFPWTSIRFHSALCQCNQEYLVSKYSSLVIQPLENFVVLPVQDILLLLLLQYHMSDASTRCLTRDVYVYVTDKKIEAPW